MATEQLLKDFPPVSTAAWEAAIARDLKGADYEKKLIWHTEEGLDIKPYYREEDLKGIACIDSAPGSFPFRRGNRTTGGWRIREEISATNVAEANAAACSAVAAGAEEIAFAGILFKSADAVEPLFANLGQVPLHFTHGDRELIWFLLNRLNDSNNHIHISTGCGALECVDFAAEVIQAAPAVFVPFMIHAETFEEAGATAIQQIGFALAAGVDFLAAMDERGVAAGRTAAAIEFSFAVGSNYFIEIAKLRAFRMTWARIVERFGGGEQLALTRIAAHTSRWSKTVYDPHVNILRATTETMAAVLGGADSVTVAPFDACRTQPDDASRRLARNTQLLLKHEACLGRVADAGGGSYYLEAITDRLAREAWKIMQNTESQGGYRSAQSAGTISRAIDQSLAAREAAVATRRHVFVGTNQFADPAEHVLGRADMERMHETRRGALAFEQLRLRTEQHAAIGKRVPHVLLAEIGDIKMRSARSTFAANFFACAGFDTVIKRFKKAEDIAASSSDLIVLCSSDREYPVLAANLIPRLKALGSHASVIVAGNPADADQLGQAGVADFVHLRSNALEILTKWQERLGVRE